MTYEQYWNLKEKPFEEVGDTRFFFESTDHREALDRLLYLVNDYNMNIGLLTGEVGSGKTITKNVFLHSLARSRFEIISFSVSAFSFVDILYDIVTRITFKNPGIEENHIIETPVRNDKYQLCSILKKKLDILNREEHRHLVLIFDETQLIEPSVLDEIKNLANLSPENTNALTIFFVGQPELRERIRQMKQIDQRIFLRFHLNNLDYSNMVNYIRHRLLIAGMQQSSIFTDSAYETLYRNSGGIPRQINRLCKLAMTYGFAQNLEEITHEEIELVLQDIRKYS